jgi:hypothetical protein
MSYEYENAMGYLMPGQLSIRPRIVEVYGTMPEAQEFIREEFDLPGLPPAYALAPPANPRTDPYRRVTTIPIPTPLGNDAAPSFFDQHKKWLVPAGVIVGGYFMARALGIFGDKRIFANPPIKDVKYQETGPTGHIPSRQGEMKIIDSSKLLSPGRYKTKQSYIDACLEITPDALEFKKLPASFPFSGSFGPEDKRERAIESTKKFFLKILLLGRNKFSPLDWVSGPNLYFRLRSFASIPVRFSYDGVLRNTPARNTIMALWEYLGMPSGAALTAKSREHIKTLLGGGKSWRFGIPGGQRSHAARLITKLDRIGTHLCVYNPELLNPKIIWQISLIRSVARLKDMEFIKLCEWLNETPVLDQWRVRWLVQKEITTQLDWFKQEGLIGRRPELPRGENVEQAMALPEKEFVALYGPYDAGSTAWARLHGHVPENEYLRNRKPQTVASVPIKPLLRAMRSKELVGYVEGEAKKIEEEHLEDYLSTIGRLHQEIENGLSDIQYNKTKIKGFREHIKELKIARKKTFALINDLEINKTMYVNEDGYKAWDRLLKAAYRSYALDYNLIKQNFSAIKRAEHENKQTKSRLRWRREHLRDSIHRLEKMKKEGVIARWLLRDVEENRANAAIALSVVFGSNWQGWLRRMKRRGVDLHDATYWLPTIESPGLGEYLTKYWESPLKALSKIARSWNDLGENEQKMRPRELTAWISSKKYSNARSTSLAMEAALWGVSASDYYKIEDRWLRALMKKGGKVPSAMPKIDVREDDYRMYRLEKNDPRALFLGEYTDCCQSVGNVGGPCTWFGVEDTNSGFYVIEDRAGNIIAQSWAWIAEPYLVFDSIEGKGLSEASSSRQNLIAKMYEKAASQIMDKYPWIYQVRIGHHPLDPDELDTPWQVADNIVDTPKKYGGKYSDARGIQYIIRSKEIEYGIPGVGKSLNVRDVE